MFNIFVDYPDEAEELDIIKLTTATYQADLAPVLTGQDILSLQEIVRRVPVSDHVIKYALRLTRSTRVTKPDAPDYIKEWLSWGAGPRASQYLILGGKARALLKGRFYVSTEDIRAVAHPVLRHRIITNFTAEAQGIKPDDIVDRLIADIPAAESEVLADGRLPQVLGSQGS
jgi:MoxR-like ATPase